MMNCIDADKLTLYVDGLLEPNEQKEVMQHLGECKECRIVMSMFEQENKVLKETLSAPKLPDSFADDVLAQLQPLKSKRKAYWIRGAEVAAAVVLCVGLASAVSPGFGGFVSSLFSQDKVELEEKVLAELIGGIIYPVDYVVEGERRKLVIKHLIVDVNQVGFTFQVMNERGKVLEPEFTARSLYFQKPDGSLVTGYESSIDLLENGYGYFETRLSHIVPEDKLILKIDLVTVGDRDEHLVVKLPVDLSEARELAKVVEIEDGQRVIEGHDVHFEKMLLSPNQTSITYTIGKTEAFDAAQKEMLANLEEEYGRFHIGEMAELSFTLTNEDGERVANLDQFAGHSEGLIGTSMFHPGGDRLLGHEVKFKPIKDEQLFLHVNGIYYIQVEEGKVSFNLERLTLTKPRMELTGATYTVRNMNMQGEQLVVSVDVEKSSEHFYVDNWVLIDGNGDRYHSNAIESSVNDAGVGYLNMEFNKPAVVGPFTLVALSSYNYVPLEESVVIEVK